MKILQESKDMQRKMDIHFDPLFQYKCISYDLHLTPSEFYRPMVIDVQMTDQGYHICGVKLVSGFPQMPSIVWDENFIQEQVSWGNDELCKLYPHFEKVKTIKR